MIARAAIDRWQRLAPGARFAFGVMAVLVVLGAGFALDPVGLRRAWMAALLVIAGPAIGALGLLLLGHLAPGGSLMALRPRLQALAWTVPLLALLAAPLLGGFEDLYPPPASDAETWKGGGGITARLLVLALLWTGLAWLASRPRSAAVGALGLLIYVPSVSIAAIDWLMALVPGWTSSVTGLLFLAQSFMAALASAILATPRAGLAKHDARGLAGLLLAGVLIVVYLAFVQFLVVWSANLPAEAAWYARRHAPLGSGALILLAALAGLAAVAWLLGPSPSRHAAAAGLALGAYGLHRLWEVAPSFPEPPPLLLLLLSLAAIGALWLIGWHAMTGVVPVPSGRPRVRAAFRAATRTRS